MEKLFKLSVGSAMDRRQWCAALHMMIETPSVTLDGDKVLVHCHAGCSQSEVIEALKCRDLWVSEPSAKSRPVLVYIYVSDSNKPLYRVIRYEPKTFKQQTADGYGGWIWKGPKNDAKVLYRLSELQEAPRVFVVEGEKDVETLRSNGFVATTNIGGAKQPWLPQYSEALAGREVILIPDNDEPGRNRVVRIARALFGKVARLAILELDGAKDITEWFEAGHSVAELSDLVGSETVQ